MKILVNYGVQDEKDPRHDSEILNIISPPYSFSPEPTATEVMKWAKRKQGELSDGKKLIVLSMFKI